MGGMSWWHWLIIAGVFVLLFGAKKLPDTARGLGRSLRILKSEVSAMHEDGQAASGSATAAPAAVGPGAPASAALNSVAPVAGAGAPPLEQPAVTVTH